MHLFMFLLLGLALAVTSVRAQNETEAQKRALDVLHKTIADMEHPAPAKAPAPAAPKPKPAPAPAPAVKAAPAPAPAPAADDQRISEIHRRALEVLHQQIAATPPSSAGAGTMTDREAEGRARLMLHEQQRAVDSARPKDAYQQGVEDRARASAPKASATASAPAKAAPPSNLDTRAEELLRQQQLEEKKAKKSAPKAEMASSSSSDDPNAAIHARALQVLHQTTAATQPPPSQPAEMKPVAKTAKEKKDNEAAKPPVKAAKQEKEKPDNKAEKKASAKPAKKEASEPASAAAPAPMTKQQKLADLLERYKSDQVTPAQYQEERAKILSEP